MALLMEHCAIECTSKAMSQALRKFTRHQKDIQDNPYELAHIENLYELCKEFVDEFEEYVDDEEEYIINHSE